MYWKEWLESTDIPTLHRRFYYFTICQFSPSQRDGQLHGPIGELFQKVGYHPKQFAENPQKVMRFFHSCADSARSFPDIDDDIDDDDIDDDNDDNNDGKATKGIIYWYSKVKHFLFNCKLICLHHLAQNELREYSDTIEIQERELLLLGHSSDLKILAENWDEPLPKSLLQPISLEKCILPSTFEPTFYLRMKGFHHKCTALVAESIYDVPYGIAVDRHVQRFTITHGIVSGTTSNSAERHMQTLLRIYEKRQYPIVNEVPCALSQIIRSSECASANELVNLVMKVAEKFGMTRHLQDYLSLCKKP